MRAFQIIFFILLTFILVSCTDNEHSTFNNLNEAEKEIGEIKKPSLPANFKIQQITYDNDNFTHPVTKILYKKGNHRITFMTTSSWYDDSPSEKIKNDKAQEIYWITEDKKYILKWRESNKESYKYLITTNKKDKKWLISVAENY